MSGPGHQSVAAAPAWRRVVTEDEFVWLRLVRTLDEVQTTIARLEQGGADARALAAVARLREDLVAALRLAVGSSRSG